MSESWCFTVHTEDSTRTLYASTNRFLKRALLWIDHMFVTSEDEGDPPRPAALGSLSFYDRLLPLELRCLEHRPAQDLMRHFLSQHFGSGSWRFFDPDSDGGLIPSRGYRNRSYAVPSEADTSTIKLMGRMYDFLSWFGPDEVVPEKYLPKAIPTLEKGTVATVAHACRRWAHAFMHTNEPNTETGYYGHRVTAPPAVELPNRSWRLYNNVHCGNRPADVVDHPLPGWSEARLEPVNPVESSLSGDKLKEAVQIYGTFRHRFQIESFPDSWWVFAGEHGAVCQAYELLATLSTDEQDRPARDDLQAFARQLAHGIWHERLRQDVYLMPSTVTPRGPIFEQSGDLRRPIADTDSLYWVHPMYKAYEIARYGRPACGLDRHLKHPEPRTDLSGADYLDRFLERRQRRKVQRWRFLRRRLLRRRKLVATGLPPAESDFTAFPEAYLRMALAVTIDWILRTWRTDWGQLGWIADYAGQRPSAGWNATIGNDGKYNTLRILIGAFRATHDPLYLWLFEQSWKTYERAALEWTEDHVHRINQNRTQKVKLDDLLGLVPDKITQGHISSNAAPDAAQTGFVGFLVTMHNEARAADITPKVDFLAAAEALAELAMSRLLVWQSASVKTGKPVEQLYGLNSPNGFPLVQLAQARRTLRLVSLHFPEPVERFSVTHGGEEQWFNVPEPPLSEPRTVTRAVIYMDEGTYTIGDALGSYTAEDESGTLRPAITITSDATFILRR